eukprot:g71844.t1
MIVVNCSKLRAQVGSFCVAHQDQFGPPRIRTAAEQKELSKQQRKLEKQKRQQEKRKLINQKKEKNSSLKTELGHILSFHRRHHSHDNGVQKLDPPHLERQQSQVGKELEADLRTVWKNAESVVFKDLPRLAARMTVESFPSGIVVNLELPRTPHSAAEPPSPSFDAKESGTDAWSKVGRTVLLVASQLEDQAAQVRIQTGLRSIAKMISASQGADLEESTRAFFDRYVSRESKTWAIFQATHQSILFPAILYLRKRVFSEEVGMTKDVRRPEGWMIKIQLGDANSVTHTRWEQSLEPPDSPQHFEVCWEIRLTFDRDMKDLKAVFLRIMDLKLHTEMPHERREQLQEILRGGGYIVCQQRPSQTHPPVRPDSPAHCHPPLRVSTVPLMFDMRRGKFDVFGGRASPSLASSLGSCLRRVLVLALATGPFASSFLAVVSLGLYLSAR